MGGGLMQLVAYGAQDIYLTGNPQITFFKVVYRRHTNFSMEAIEQVFDGTQAWGKQVSATISRNGDLVHKMYYEYSPLHMFKGFVKHQNSAMFITPKLGNTLLKEVEVEIGGQRIDRHYSHWLSVWSDLTDENKTGVSAFPNTDGAVGGAQGLSQDVSTQLEVHAGLLGNAGTATLKQIDSFNHRGFMLADNCSRAVEETSYVNKSNHLSNWRTGEAAAGYREIQSEVSLVGAKSYDEPFRGCYDNSVDPSLPDASFVPLQFWFCRNPGLALPLIALQYHEVKVKITLCDQDSVVAGAYAAGYGKMKDKDDVGDLASSLTAKKREDPAVGDESVNPYRSLLFNNFYSSNTGLTARTEQTPSAALGPYPGGKLWADYIYLDTDERRRFAQVSHEYLIEQLQFQNFSSGDSETANLNFNHPVKELIWTGVPVTNARVAPISKDSAGKARVCPRYVAGNVIDNGVGDPRAEIDAYLNDLENCHAARQALPAARQAEMAARVELDNAALAYNAAVSADPAIGTQIDAWNTAKGASTHLYIRKAVTYADAPFATQNVLNIEGEQAAQAGASPIDAIHDAAVNFAAKSITWLNKEGDLEAIKAVLHRCDAELADLLEALVDWKPTQTAQQRFFFDETHTSAAGVLNPWLRRVDNRVTELNYGADMLQCGAAVPGSLTRSPIETLDLDDNRGSARVNGDKALYESAKEVTTGLDFPYKAAAMEGALYKVDADSGEPLLPPQLCETLRDVKNYLKHHSPLDASKRDAFVTSRNRITDPFITQVPKMDAGGRQETWCLKLNGHERFAPRPTTYFTRTQINQHHTGYGGIIQPDSIGVYSFALKPEEHQPSGTCNFSRIDNAQLIHPKMPAVPPCWSLVSGRSAGLNVYAINYNVLRIMSGMGGLAYSN